MADTVHSITLDLSDDGRSMRLSIHAPLRYSSGGLELLLDEKSPAFQALSKVWDKSSTTTGAATVLCAPVILNYSECSTLP